MFLQACRVKAAHLQQAASKELKPRLRLATVQVVGEDDDVPWQVAFAMSLARVNSLDALSKDSVGVPFSAVGAQSCDCTLLLSASSAEASCDVLLDNARRGSAGGVTLPCGL